MELQFLWILIAVGVMSTILPIIFGVFSRLEGLDENEQERFLMECDEERRGRYNHHHGFYDDENN